MIYKQSLVADKGNSTFEIPEEFFGKKVEITIVEIGDAISRTRYRLPPGKKVSASELLEHFGQAPDFPSIDEIRAKAWPKKW